MRFCRSSALLCLAAIAFCAVPVGAQAPSVAPAPAPALPAGPAHLAIANPSRIFKDIQETKAMRDKLEARRKELLAKEMELRQNIETLMKQRADVNPNHPKYREITDQIINAKATLQSWGAANKASVELDQKMMVKTLFDKIEASIAEVAQQNNIDIVIADGRRDIEGIEDMSFEDLQRVLSTRNVLYANKGFDLSEKVITLMDAKFAKEKK